MSEQELDAARRARHMERLRCVLAVRRVRDRARTIGADMPQTRAVIERTCAAILLEIRREHETKGKV